MKSVRIDYYAYFREKRGLSSEQVQTEKETLAELYAEIASRHGFRLPSSATKVVVNDEFRDMGDAVEEGATVAFLPPVAGG